MEPHAYDVGEIVKHAFVAVIAGFAHALHEGKRKGTKLDQFMEFIASVVIASFSGVIFGLVALEIFGQGSYLSLAITGSGGFIGAKALKVLSETIVEFIRAMVIPKK
jgi:hypothetical protein